MKISIGMMAYNEATRIGQTIASLAEQDLLGPSGETEVEIVCVPNGCTDDTAGVAAAAFEKAFPAGGRVRWRVESTPTPGKCNAWNRFVHEHSRRDADVLLLIDSDVVLHEKTCLSTLAGALEASPEAYVAAGLAVKDIAFRKQQSVMDRLSLAGTTVKTAGRRPAIAGGLYAARASVLRRIWLPPGLLVEDGFLKAMLVTDFFTVPSRPDRLVRPEGATLIFEACRGIRPVFKHSKRLAVGVCLNALIYDKIWNREPGTDAAEFVRRKMEEDPQWLQALMRERVKSAGWWVMPGSLLWKHFESLRKRGMAQKLKRLPVVIGATLFDGAVLWAANRAIKRGELRW